jgi:hypothetical protein
MIHGGECVKRWVGFGEAALASDRCSWLLEEDDVIFFGGGKSESAIVCGRVLADVGLEDFQASLSVWVYARPSCHILGTDSCCRRLLRGGATAPSGSGVVATMMQEGAVTFVLTVGLLALTV